MEANGTWPTHIAQLLFSGLGQGTRQARPAVAAAGTQRRSTASSIFPTISATSAFAAAERRQQQQQQQRHHTASSAMGFRYQPPAGSSAFGRSGGLPSQVAPSTGFSAAAARGTDGGPLPSAASSLGANPFAPPSTQARTHPRRRTASSRMSTSAPGATNNPHYDPSPWSTGASVSAALGPRGFVGHRSSMASSTSASPFQPFNNPVSDGGSSGGRIVSSNVNGASSVGGAGGSSPFFTEGEEELLSTLSPSSYIRRLHRELEGGNASVPRQDRTSTGQYQFNTISSTATGRTSRRNANRTAAPLAAPSQSDNPFSMFSAAPSPAAAVPFHGQSRNQRRNEWNGRAIRSSGTAGRSLETALEIESDDDDDVVEVIDVEALI